MKFSTTILCAALLFASQAEAQRGGRGGRGNRADKTVVRCRAEAESDGFESGKLFIGQRNPTTDTTNGEVTTYPARIRSVWKDVEEDMTYSVKLFDDVIDTAAEGFCSDLSSVAFDLGSFDVTEEDGDKKRYRPDASLYTDLDNSSSAGLIAALIDSEMDEVVACCVLEVYEC